MDKIEFEVDASFGAEYAGNYVAREIPWALRKEIIEKHTNYNRMTGQVIKINHTAIQAEYILASLKQPKTNPVTLERLLGKDIETCLPPRLAELIEKNVNSVIAVSLAEKKT